MVTVNHIFDHRFSHLLIMLFDHVLFFNYYICPLMYSYFWGVNASGH